MNYKEKILSGATTAFIDASYKSSAAYKPSFISNDHTNGVKVMTTIEFLPTSANYTTGDLTFSATGNASFYSSYFRLRSNNTLTFSVPEGLKIAEIVFTPYSASYALAANVDNGSYNASTYTWTGESQSVTFTVTTSSTYMRGIKVTYKD